MIAAPAPGRIGRAGWLAVGFAAVGVGASSHLGDNGREGGLARELADLLKTTVGEPTPAT